jgi:hypothetical protein
VHPLGLLFGSGGTRRDLRWGTEGRIHAGGTDTGGIPCTPIFLKRRQALRPVHGLVPLFPFPPVRPGYLPGSLQKGDPLFIWKVRKQSRVVCEILQCLNAFLNFFGRFFHPGIFLHHVLPDQGGGSFLVIALTSS